MTEDEFRAFVAARGSALRRTGFLLTGDWQLGEDLIQTALLATWRRLDRLRESPAIETYIRTAMARTYLSWRRVRRFAELPTAVVRDRDGGADPSDEVLERDRIWAELHKLPANQRAALVLRYYEDLQVETIADMLGSRTGTVKSHLSRGLATLRAALEREQAKETQ